MGNGVIDVFLSAKGYCRERDHDNVRRLLQGDPLYSTIHYRDIFMVVVVGKASFEKQ